MDVVIVGAGSAGETVQKYFDALAAGDPDAIFGLVRGDLGTSSGNVPVMDRIATAFPITIQLTLLGLVLAVVLALVFGVVAALYRGRWPDQLLRVLSIAALATPSFWLAILPI